jgi:hypothetical protein
MSSGLPPPEFVSNERDELLRALVDFDGARPTQEEKSAANEELEEAQEIQPQLLEMPQGQGNEESRKWINQTGPSLFSSQTRYCIQIW